MYYNYSICNSIMSPKSTMQLPGLIFKRFCFDLCVRAIAVHSKTKVVCFNHRVVTLVADKLHGETVVMRGFLWY